MFQNYSCQISKPPDVSGGFFFFKRVTDDDDRRKTFFLASCSEYSKGALKTYSTQPTIKWFISGKERCGAFLSNRPHLVFQAFSRSAEWPHAVGATTAGCAASPVLVLRHKSCACAKVVLRSQNDLGRSEISERPRSTLRELCSRSSRSLFQLPTPRNHL